MAKKLNLGHILVIKDYLFANFASFSKTQTLTDAQKSTIKTNIGVTDAPTTYIKNAEIANGILTLTKQDGTKVNYSYDDSNILARLSAIETKLAAITLEV